MRALAFSLDDAYVMPFTVLFHSLIETDSLPDDIPIFVLHERSLSEPSKESIAKFLSRCGRSAQFIDACGYIPDDLPLSEDDHVSRATFFRLFVGSILPSEVTSLVYLDSDMVALRSVQILFALPLKAPLAAVDHLSHWNAVRLWGEQGGTYFQAGVLVIDLEVWRRQNVESRFISLMRHERNRIRWWDQDVLNLAFPDQWQRLEIWLNVVGMTFEVVSEKDAVESARILHFDGAQEPWFTDGGAPGAKSTRIGPCARARLRLFRSLPDALCARRALRLFASAGPISDLHLRGPHWLAQ
ncbi:MAG: glycosyltransferase family 8 protein [Thiohalocapsa sp.]